MTQARTPAGTAFGSGAGDFMQDADQFPAAVSWNQSVGRANRLDNVDEFAIEVLATSTGEVARFVAKENGRIVGATVHNGATAADGTNGWVVDVKNEDQADELIAQFGVGTVGAGADEVDVDANAIAHYPNSLAASETDTAKYFNYGDVLTVDVTESGTAGAFDIFIKVEYGSQGHV